jgi:glutathione S-transferase
MGVRVILEETGAPYELIETSIDMDQPRPPEMLALNPNGWVPVLVWERGAIYECGAIITFLCDRHPEFNLAPGVDDPERGLFLQWLFFFSSSIQNAFQMSYYPFRFCSSEQDYASVQQRSVLRLNELWQVVDNAIGDSQWILGDRFSAADIYLFMLVTWLSREHNHPAVEAFPNVARITRSVMQRPAIQLVYHSWIEQANNGG